MSKLDEFRQALNALDKEVWEQPDGSLKCQCPSHPDRDPSLHVSVGAGGKLLLKCHGGCHEQAVLRAVGWTYSDLYPGPKKSVNRSWDERNEDITDQRDRLNEVYQRLLGILSLSDDHRQHLLDRGFSEDAIIKNGYKTLDLKGSDKAVRALTKEFGQELCKVHGFQAAPDGLPSLVAVFGILIPVRDRRARIRGFQVRTFDNEKGKYLWLSGGYNRSRPGDKTIHTSVHVPLNTPSTAPTVRLTEGPLKADLIRHLDPTGPPVIGVAGIGAWEKAVPVLQRLKPPPGVEPFTVILAFDSDWETKPQVAHKFFAAGNRLSREGWKVKVSRWDGEKAKGLDDALYAHLTVTSADFSILPKAIQVDEDIDDGDGKLISIPMNDIEMRASRWLWKNRIPFGGVTVLDGDPGLGKSTLMAYLIASVTTGTSLPGDSMARKDAGTVLWFSAEDAPHETLSKRINAAGADPGRIFYIDGVSKGESSRLALLPDDFDEIEREIRRRGPSLVIFDPLFSFLSGQIDSYKDSSIRLVMGRLNHIAETYGCAVVVVRHLNKLIGGPAMYRGGGSIGIIGAARSGLLFARHPTDQNRRVLAHVKANNGPLVKSLVFLLDRKLVKSDKDIPEDELDEWSVGYMTTVSDSAAEEMDPDDLVSKANNQSGAAECAREITNYLRENGPVEQLKLQHVMTKDQGYNTRMYFRAKKFLGVKSLYIGGKGRASISYLPDQEEAAQEAKETLKAKPESESTHVGSIQPAQDEDSAPPGDTPRAGTKTKRGKGRTRSRTPPQ